MKDILNELFEKNGEEYKLKHSVDRTHNLLTKLIRNKITQAEQDLADDVIHVLKLSMKKDNLEDITRALNFLIAQLEKNNNL